MGFYGNITNTSNTTFQFDRIYSNKREMDSNVNNDGIFIGRYVLVEYDQDAAYPVVFMNKQTNKFYSSKNFDQATEIRYISGDKSDEYILTTDTSVVSGKQYYKLENDKYIDVSLNSNDNPRALGLYEYVSTSDGVYKDEIVQVQEVTSDEKTGNLITIFIGFYQCEGTYDGEHAQLKQLDKDPNAAKSNYIKNFAIDEKHLNGEQQKSFKGYDSTVWMKSSVTASDGKLITKYVNIADLNSVVPTFDIAADAPTMTPITPHFDADSTNVYYKLHAQPQWGFRIAKADADKSDENTQWIREFYNPNNDTSTKKYASSVTDGIPDWSDDSTATLPAAIYFNEDGFKKQLINTDERQGEIKKHSTTVTENTIKIEPTGKSGIEYNTHNGSNEPSTSIQVDTQELTINLPAIGNMMSDAWDIIHGPNRDNARTDKNSSLQGRLDSFEAFYDNQIPVKIQDGTLVGSKINNAKKYDDWENKPQDILDDKTSPNFERDDAWIRTEINTNDLKNGDKDSEIDNQLNNSGISIHHTFHKTNDSTTQLNKNTGEAQQNSDYKSQHISAIRDQDGNIISSSINSENGNKDDYIKLYTPYVDAMGHVVGKNIETIKLPYGYKSITITNDGNKVNAAPDNMTGTQTADSTQASIKFNTSNKWVVLDAGEEDTIKFGHLLKTIVEDKKLTQNLSSEESKTITFEVYDDSFDEAGHHNGRDTKTITMPFGYGKITGDNGNTAATATYDELNVVSGDDWINTEVSQDTVTVTHTGPVVATVETKSNIENPSFGSTFVIEDWHFDNKGHMHTPGKTHTVQFPKGNIIHPTTYSNNAEIITNLAFNPESGVISYQKDNSGTLKLTANYTNEGIGSGSISGGDSLNTAFAKLEKQVMKEANDRATDILKEVSDRNLAISSAISAIVDKDDDDTINKLAEVIDWINNNPSTATQMQTAIQNNTTAIGNEKTRAEGIEAGLQEQIDALGSASDYATADQGALAETAIQKDTEFNYGEEQKTIQDLMNIVKAQANTIINLTERIEALENPITTE